MRKRQLICLLATACLLPMSALADKYGPSWEPEIGWESGITFGGGNLLTSGVTGQPNLTPPTSSLYAGNTFFFQGYYRQAIGHTGLSFKAAAGGSYVCQVPVCLDVLVDVFGNTTIGTYQSGNVTGDLAVEYAWDGGRVGIGRTARLLNSVTSGSSAYPFQDVYLKPAQGWFLEYEVDHFGLRYNHLIYRSSVSNYSLNASNVGVYVHVNYHDEDWYPGGQYYRQGEMMTRETLALAFNPREWSL